ncbi:phosphate uptake regulator PhoU [Candidatus Woesearchaeota archaeon]|nr:phosphate uptake regulator PhoU [Candidatus Woesearchaeota archaeon]
MEFRKIIKFGKSSYVVSLPSDWIKKNNIKKGDQIFFEESSNNALIFKINNTPNKIIKKKININSTNKSLIDIERLIISYYVKGYNTFAIIDNNMATRSKKIKAILQNLIGLEILEQTQKRLEAKDLTDINAISIEGLIKRMDIIIRSMMEDSVNCLSYNKKEIENAIQSINDRDNDVNRLTFLGYRVLRFYFNYPHLINNKNLSNQKIFLNLTAIDNLEKIADTIKRRTRLYYKINKDQEYKKELTALLKELQNIYANAMKAYLTEDTNLAFKIVSTKDIVIDTHKKFLSKYNDVETALITENLNSKLIYIRNLARTILG